MRGARMSYGHQRRMRLALLAPRKLGYLENGRKIAIYHERESAALFPAAALA